MAENARPQDAPPLRVDLVKRARDKQFPPQKSTHAPMASDRIYNTGLLDDASTRTQLISPPPEETLAFRRTSKSYTPSLLSANAAYTSSPPKSITSKRKRTIPIEIPIEPPQPAEATPNPKPRKQSKRQSPYNDSPTRPSFSRPALQTTPSKPNKPLLTKSPHALNPDADYIPDVLSSVPKRAVLSARTRRTTPIPPYEPPKEVFTPPREVIMTPTISKSSKRKTGTKSSKAKSLELVIPLLPVKKELPDIDLSAPMPPPSPTDDPLLLSGPIMPPSSTPTRPPRGERRDVGVITSASFTTPPIVDDLPPSSSPVDDMEDVQTQFDWTKHMEPEGSTDFSMMDEEDADVPRLPLFNLDLAAPSGEWSDSDDNDDGSNTLGGEEPLEGQGEYTGKWRMLKVRTKLDPPSSATRDRMEAWGRPITPFPNKISRLDPLSEVEVEVGPENIDIEGSVEEGREEGEGGEEIERDDIYAYPEDEPEDHQVYSQGSVELDVEQESQEDMAISPEDAHQPFDFSTSFNDSQEPSHLYEGDASYDTSLDQEQISSGEENSSPEEEEPSETTILPLVEQEDAFNPEGVLDEEHLVLVNEPALQQLVNADDVDEQEEEEVREMSVEYQDDEVVEGDISSQMVEPVTPAPIFTPRPPAHRALLEDTDEHELLMGDADEVLADSVERDDSSDDSDTDVDDGIVKITSADPRAAARAAAILKQHDYDCFTKIMMKKKQRRYSHSTMDELAKGTRRQDVIGAGITKSNSKKENRRRTTMGVIGDRVYIPGSPAMTLPQLLQEAEAEVVASPLVKTRIRERDPFKTPLPNRYIGSALGRKAEIVEMEEGERSWTKEEWKLLDACFTDERLELGARLGLVNGEELAAVDLVRVEDVVERFILILGGSEIVRTFGDAWDRENLFQRAKALQNKQRSGNVAPPTTPYTPSPGSAMFGASRRIPSMDVPDFTPLGRRPMPLRKERPILPPPVLENAPFTNLPEENERSTRKLPPSLLAPRYSHLLEEAIAISSQDTEGAGASVVGVPLVSETESELPTEIAFPSMNEDPTKVSKTMAAAPATIGKRVKGFLFSYLPTLSKTAPPASRKGYQLPRQPGLPLPPLDVLEKPRGPISTPIRVPVPKPKHPKELVHLNPAPQPEPKTTMIPRAKKPQRMVELHPLPQPPSIPEPVVVPRPRRSSGASVKDLVKNFENLDGRKEAEPRRLKKGEKTVSKPGWKP